MDTVGPTSAHSLSKQRAAVCWQLARGPIWSPAAVRTNLTLKDLPLVQTNTANNFGKERLHQDAR